MDENLLFKLRKAAENGMLYDHIANSYTDFSKEELKEIISELVYVATYNLSYKDSIKFQKEVVNSIEDNW